MKLSKKLAALALCVLLAISCAGCGVPELGFDDYDVSGYIQALLDSTYHDSHNSLIAITGTSEEIAKQNHASTVENAAVNFCNTYNLSPSEAQLTTFREIMSQALSQAKYTVKEEQKTATGYYIEVEVSPIGNFAGLAGTLSDLRNQAMDEASAANAVQTPQGVLGEGQDGYEPGDDEDDDEYYEDEAEPTPTPVPTPAPTPSAKVDPYQLYMDKVVAYCQSQTGAISYQAQNVTIALDIRQTAAGELQIDLNQVDTLDKTVLMFGEVAVG